MTFFIANVATKAMADDLTLSTDAGTAAVFRILDGTIPADADAAESGTLGGTLTATASPSAGAATDSAPGALLTFNAIADDSSADNAITTTYYRMLTQTGGTVISQGQCATSAQELNWNTVSITAGSTLSITSYLVTHPES